MIEGHYFVAILHLLKSNQSVLYVSSFRTYVFQFKNKLDILYIIENYFYLARNIHVFFVQWYFKNQNELPF